MNRTYNIFISHSWTYSDAYEKLLQLLTIGTNFEYRNYSVPKNDPVHNAKNDRELYEAIKRQMQSASVVLILAGVYSSYSKWINNEIYIAKNAFITKKPGICPKRAKESYGSKYEWEAFGIDCWVCLVKILMIFPKHVLQDIC